jgi:hypothetical protein
VPPGARRLVSPRACWFTGDDVLALGAQVREGPFDQLRAAAPGVVAAKRFRKLGELHDENRDEPLQSRLEVASRDGECGEGERLDPMRRLS